MPFAVCMSKGENLRAKYKRKKPCSKKRKIISLQQDDSDVMSKTKATRRPLCYDWWKAYFLAAFSLAGVSSRSAAG